MNSLLPLPLPQDESGALSRWSRIPPSQAAMTAVHGGQRSSASDATVPSVYIAWTIPGEISMCPELPDMRGSFDSFRSLVTRVMR